MSVVDILIIAFMLIYIGKGFANGILKEGVSFLGGLAVFVIAFFLKNPISVFMYEHLPFFKMSGLLSGITVLNIIMYELLAFLLIAGILLFIYRLILKATNLIEVILKITIILEIPSKILGAILGFVEGIVVIFIFLFVFMQFESTKTWIDESKYANGILTKTPILGDAISPVYDSITEIYKVAENYKDEKDRDQANLECLDILLKYKVLSTDSAKVLMENNKLKMPGIEDVIKKYENIN